MISSVFCISYSELFINCNKRYCAVIDVYLSPYLVQFFTLNSAFLRQQVKLKIVELFKMRLEVLTSDEPANVLLAVCVVSRFLRYL